MALWKYSETENKETILALGQACQLELCPFCSSRLLHIAGNQLAHGKLVLVNRLYLKGEPLWGKQLKACPCCGWWVASEVERRECINRHDDGLMTLRRTCGSLVVLDQADLSTPIELLRSHLVAK